MNAYAHQVLSHYEYQQHRSISILYNVHLQTTFHFEIRNNMKQVLISSSKRNPESTWDHDDDYDCNKP